MNWLKHFFNFYIEASIHVALSVYALTFITLTKFDLPYAENCLYTVFYGSILGYNFVKFYPIFKSKNLLFNLRHKLILLTSSLALCLLLFYVIQLQFKTLLFLFICGLITLLYVFPFGKYKTLRTLPRVKIFVIALVWSLVTVLMPVIELNHSINGDVWITCLQNFLLVIVLMLPFEIRDLKYDGLDLKTLPQLIGVRKTKISGFILLVFLYLIEFLKNETTQTDILILVWVVLILFLLLKFSKVKQYRYYCSFFVEAVPIIWLVLLLLF